MVSSSDSCTNVFISYSHQDAKYLKRLKIHLKPCERSGLLDIWDDTRIEGGAVWHEEIKKALKRAKIAILLVSADFLASKFIAENELPPLLAAAKAGGTRILPIILSPCGFNDTELAVYQTLNSPSVSLAGMNFHQRESLWAKAAEIISKTEHPQAILKDKRPDLSDRHGTNELDSFEFVPKKRSQAELLPFEPYLSEYSPSLFHVSYGSQPSRATVRTQKQFISLCARSGAIEQYMLDLAKEILRDIDRVSEEFAIGQPLRKDKDEEKISWSSSRQYLMFRGAFFDDKNCNVTRRRLI